MLGKGMHDGQTVGDRFEQSIDPVGGQSYLFFLFLTILAVSECLLVPLNYGRATLRGQNVLTRLFLLVWLKVVEIAAARPSNFNAPRIGGIHKGWKFSLPKPVRSPVVEGHLAHAHNCTGVDQQRVGGTLVM